MPAPDIRYVLDGAVECGHISADTHFYLLELEPNTTQFVDNYRDTREVTTGEWWRSLIRMGNYFEDLYIGWRANNRKEAVLASYAALMDAPRQIKEMTRTIAHTMVDGGFTSFSNDALAHVQKKFDIENFKQVLGRSLRRANSDFTGWSTDEILRLELLLNGRREQNAAAYDAAVQRIMADMHQQIDEAMVHIAGLRSAASELTLKRIRQTQKEIRLKQDSERRVIKRSLRLLSRLIGNETTRLFIAGDAIRVEGRHAIYELRKVSPSIHSHGGFRALGVYAKERPDILLCNLCIGTPGVPLMDHVASLVMHIQSGHEEDILRIGNASNIDDLAYEMPWLVPHIPAKVKPREKRGFGAYRDMIERHIYGRSFTTAERTARQKLEDKFLRQALQYLYSEVLYEFVPLFRTAQLQIGIKSRLDDDPDAGDPVLFNEFITHIQNGHFVVQNEDVPFVD